MHHERPHIYDLPPIATVDISRLYANRWRNISNELREEWKQRAALINELPVIGKIESDDITVLNSNIITDSITAEAERMRAFFHSSLKSFRKTRHNLNVKRLLLFKKDKYEQGTQIFHTFYMNLLLKHFIFGTNLS